MELTNQNFLHLFDCNIYPHGYINTPRGNIDNDLHEFFPHPNLPIDVTSKMINDDNGDN